MADKPTIRVVASVIERDGKYLITQRRQTAMMPLLWEFPGGRVSGGETDAVALARCLADRMAIAVHIGEELLGVVKEYEGYVIDFHVYLCELLSDEVRRIRIQDYRWVSSDELEDFPFPAADQETVEALLRGED